MNCMSVACKAAPKKAVTGFSYLRSGKGKFFLACADHAPAYAAKLAAIGIEFRSGPICPPCSGTGTNRAFLHVQRGHCFRCDGKGHW